MKKPENFIDFCESLALPYSQAKQYFNDVIIKIDIYNDSAYFYDYFGNLESKKQDTVYNNLVRLYDVTKESCEASMKTFKQQTDSLYGQKREIISRLNKNDDFNELDSFMEKITKIMNDYNAEYNKSYKLSILNQLLNTADNYRRKKESVDLLTCEEKCKNSKSNQDTLDSKLKTIKIIIPIFSSMLSIFFCLGILYIYLKMGKTMFMQLFEYYIIVVFIFPMISSLVYHIYNKYKNI